MSSEVRFHSSFFIRSEFLRYARNEQESVQNAISMLVMEWRKIARTEK